MLFIHAYTQYMQKSYFYIKKNSTVVSNQVFYQDLLVLQRLFFTLFFSPLLKPEMNKSLGSILPGCCLTSKPPPHHVAGCLTHIPAGNRP